MELKNEMLARYARAYQEHPGLEQFRRRKKALLWGVMGLFLLLRLLDMAMYLSVGSPMTAALRVPFGLVIPGIFVLSAWRGDHRFAFLLLLPAASLGTDLIQFFRWYRRGIAEGFRPLYFVMLAAEAVTLLYLAGTTLWLAIPAENREFSVILNQITEELIRRSKEMAAAAKGGTAPPAPGFTPAPAPPAPAPVSPAPAAPPAPTPAAPEGGVPSFYQQITAAAGPEGLPEDFSLAYPGREVNRFVDGARDGIVMYHTSVTPGDVAPLHEILGLIAAGYLQAGQRLEDFFAPDGPIMLPLIDGMQDWIMDHREELDPGAFHRFAMTTLRESRNKECVKFALSLLELLDSQPEDRQVILTLALSDEFTLFCMYVIRGWEDGNDQMFRLAKQVHGWGRIFLVHELEPDTPEVRDWLLREGWRNDILSNYSAALCAKKGQLRELLSRSFLPPDQRDTVRDLVDALLVESPLPGISGLEDGEGLLREYLRHAGGMVLDEEDRRVVEAVEGYLEKKTPAGEN